MSPLATFRAELERSRGAELRLPASVSPRLTRPGGPAIAPPARRRRERRPVEATDYAAMMRRMMRAHGRRVADADVEDLAELIALREDLDAAIAYAVTESRSRWGRSWADIGRAAGMTRQSAQAKWGRS